MYKIVIVGCGDHYKSILGPSLASMTQTGIAQVVATVDIKNINDSPGGVILQAPHLIREHGQKLHELLCDFKCPNTVVVLAHAHDWHCRDAIDLVKTGFSVIIEKPYGLSLNETGTLRELAHSHPRQIAFAEYYLMMKAVPLLHAAGLLRSNSFFLNDPNHLIQADLEDANLANKHGILHKIGRPRFVYVDVL